jgi:hypothetical protein
MDKDINTGGPAFPWCGDLNECPSINLGMTIRDYFAAKAMQAIILHPQGHAGRWDLVAEESYDSADAMLRVRNGR